MPSYQQVRHGRNEGYHKNYRKAWNYLRIAIAERNEKYREDPRNGSLLAGVSIKQCKIFGESLIFW